MTWTILHEIHVEPFFDKALVKTIGSVNEAVVKLLKLRDKCDQMRAALETADVLQVDEQSRDLRAAHTEALKAEVVLRAELDAIEERVHASSCEQRNVAHAAHQQAVIDIDAALEATGFCRESCRWWRGMVLDHPAVRAAHDEAARLASLTSSRVIKLANSKSLATVEAELSQERDRVLASV